MDKRTAPTADSTTPKATSIATSNSNPTADASTSAQTPTSDPSASTPTTTPTSGSNPTADPSTLLTLEEGKDNKTLTEYVESTAKRSVTSTDGTFTLIEKSLYFSDRHTLRLCIPEKLISETLRLCHDACGHPGVRRTYLSASERFYFLRMSRKIKEHCDNCVACQTSKHSHEKPVGHLHPVPTLDEPFHTITMDFVTGLPLSHGHDALLTITDKFSKAIKLISCRTTDSAEDTAKLYL